jgi:hypothetical protein
MKAIDRPFTKIIHGTTQFVIPVFQRDYSWTEANCDQLWKDVIGPRLAPRESVREPGGEELSAHGRRPAINALVTAGEVQSISARSCFSCHLGPGPRI